MDDALDQVPSSQAAPLAVALLNYNGDEFVRRCVHSLQRQTVLPQRILYIDNGSRVFDEVSVRAVFGPRFEDRLGVLRIEKNAGYAGGFNAGLSRVMDDATSPGWVMTLSNDTELDPRFFERLLPLLQDRREAAPGKIGMLAPKVRAMDARDVLDGTGLAICLDGMSTARGQNEIDRGQYDRLPDVLAPNGVAALYRVEMLREVGFLDEDFGFYCEDTDLGLRGWLAGWDCRFVPESIVYHQRSSTIGMKNLGKLFAVERNHYWVALKNFPAPLLVLSPFLTVYRFALQAVAVFSRRGQGAVFGAELGLFRLVAVTLKGILAAMAGAPRMTRKRWRQFRVQRRSLGEVMLILWMKRLRFHDLILRSAPGATPAKGHVEHGKLRA